MRHVIIFIMLFLLPQGEAIAADSPVTEKNIPILGPGGTAIDNVDESIAYPYIRKLFVLGQLEKAQAQAEKALAINSDQPEIRVLLGNIYMKQKNSTLALEQFLIVLKDYPNFVEAWVGVIQIALEKNQGQFALKMVEKALNFTPDDPQLLYYKALSYDKLGQKENAKAAAEYLLKLYPSHEITKKLKENNTDQSKQTVQPPKA